MIILTRIAPRLAEGTAAGAETDTASGALRRLAITSLGCWSGAVVAGRLLAYTYSRLTALP
jgi:hypothetical protein